MIETGTIGESFAISLPPLLFDAKNHCLSVFFFFFYKIQTMTAEAEDLRVYKFPHLTASAHSFALCIIPLNSSQRPLEKTGPLGLKVTALEHLFNP